MKLTIGPSFNTVREPCLVQSNIRFNHFFHDPCGCDWHSRALVAHDSMTSRKAESMRIFASRIASKFIKGLFKRTMQFEVGHLQHHARRGAPPENGPTCALYQGNIPAEYALSTSQRSSRLPLPTSLARQSRCPMNTKYRETPLPLLAK